MLSHAKYLARICLLHLWKSTKFVDTLLITVLFIRTDRLSCINIRVIIVIIMVPLFCHQEKNTLWRHAVLQ